MCSTLLWRVMIHCWASGWIENFQARKDDSLGTHFRQWKKHPKTNIWNENDATSFSKFLRKTLQTSSLKLVFHAGSKMWNNSSFSPSLRLCVLDSFVCSGTTLCLNDWPRSVDAVVVIVITIIIMILEVAEKQTWARENSVLLPATDKSENIPFPYFKNSFRPFKTLRDEKLTERYELLECFWIW